MNTAQLQGLLRDFAREREQFDSPKNLAMALAGEVGELLEHFQWLTECYVSVPRKTQLLLPIYLRSLFCRPCCS